MRVKGLIPGIIGGAPRSQIRPIWGIVFLAVAGVSHLAVAESVPTLDEIRSAIEEYAQAIASGKRRGFAYTVHRSFSESVPMKHLPEAIVRKESALHHWWETFAQQDRRRALAVFRKRNRIPQSHIASWDGERLMTFQPAEGTGIIEIRNEIVYIDDYFGRLQDPFAWGLLPAGIESEGDCLQGKYHHQLDLRRLLAEEGVQVLEHIETLEESRCVVVANDEGPFLWLDADRGFVVKQFIHPAENLPGVDRIHYWNERFVELALELWAVERGFMLLRGPGIDHEHPTVQDYLCRLSLSFSDIVFNEPLGDDVFDLSFPPGTAVLDTTVPEDAPGRSTVKGFLPKE